MMKVAVLSALAALGITATGCHRGRYHDPQKMAERVQEHVDDALDDLDATAAQKTRIQAAVKKLTDSAPGFIQDNRTAKAELLRQLDASTPDAAKLHALVDARIDALRAMAHQAVDTVLETHATLTPEQRAKVSKKLHRHMDR